MKRQDFLINFLGLFDVDKIEWGQTSTDQIFGTAIYNDNERQDFCWHMSEQNVPSDDLIEIIQLIKRNNFNSNDKIVATEDIIFQSTGWTNRDKFNKTINKLFEIEIKMIDDGQENDYYFVHN